MRDLITRDMERYLAQGDPFRIEHTVQVTSFGGSGTTALCKHLIDAGVDLQPGPAQWPFKHRREPPAADAVPAGFRVLYPVGDPRDAVLSLFRRDYQIGHFESVHDRTPSRDERRRLRNLESFLAAGVDDFELADHVAQWFGHPPGYPVMFARYDEFDAAWEEIAEFLELGPKTPPFRVRVRRSDWRNESPAVRIALTEMYGELADRIADLDPVHVV